ncbi:hypothetical protein NDU88_004757 [Pleurodeles waltl]|uniref:Uncharacterized protein n=1 Tax=Pleurodeles waltl TaxID=8319 RepID=A0AAV7WBA7_PLEWA|nr:hypothetical protein NDU88_004757 [Pleurodeles waltl]
MRRRAREEVQPKEAPAEIRLAEQRPGPRAPPNTRDGRGGGEGPNWPERLAWAAVDPGAGTGLEEVTTWGPGAGRSPALERRQGTPCTGGPSCVRRLRVAEQA